MVFDPSVFDSGVFDAPIAGSFTADAVTQKTQPGSFTADAYIWYGGTQNARLTQAAVEVVYEPTDQNARLTQAAVEVVYEPTDQNARLTQLAVEVLYRPYVAGSFTADAYIVATQTGSFTADAAVALYVTASFTADAIIAASVAGSVPADATFFATVTPSPFTADAVVGSIPVVESSVVAYAAIRGTRGSDFASLAAIDPYWYAWSATWWNSTTAGGSLTADAVVQRTQNGSVPATAIVRATRPGSFTADACIQKTTQASFTADARVAGWFRADARIAGDYDHYEFTFTADAVVRGSRTDSLTATAGILATVSRTLTGDAVLRATQAAFLTADARFHPVFTADAAIAATISASLTATANIGRHYESITADAIVRKTIHIPWTGVNDEIVWYRLNAADLEFDNEVTGEMDLSIVTGSDKSTITGPAGIESTALTLNLSGRTTHYYHWRPEQFPSGASPFTYAVWINTTATTPGVLFSLGIQNATTGLFQFGVDSSYLWFNRGSTLESYNYYYGTNLRNGLWHHIAFAYDGANYVYVYIDGALVSTKTVGLLATVNTQAYLAKSVRYSNSGSNAWWSGSLSTFKTFNRMLSAAEIATLYVPPPAPTAIFAQARLKKTNFHLFAEIHWRWARSISAKAYINPAPPTTFYYEFYADAFVIGPGSGSFTADALIVTPPFVSSGSLGLTAAISQTHRRAAMTADASLMRRVPELFWANAAISTSQPTDDTVVWWDDFERFVDPGLGQSTSGGTYTWVDYDSASGSAEGSNVYVDGSAAVFPSAPTGGQDGYNYESYSGLPNLALAGRIRFDFWVPPVAGQAANHPLIVFRWPQINVSVYPYNVGAWRAYVNGVYAAFSPTASSWYSAEYSWTPTINDAVVVQIWVWPQGEDRPENVTGSGTTTVLQNSLSYIDFYYSAYSGYDFKIDNLQISLPSDYVTPVSSSFTATARITRGVPTPGSFSADAYLTKGFIRAYANIGRWYGSFTADAALMVKWRMFLPITADALIDQGHFYADASIIAPRVLEFPYLIATVVGLAQFGSFTADAALGGRSFTANAFIQPYFTANAFIKTDAIIYWDENGNPIYNNSRDYKQRIEVVVDGTDITADVVPAETSFTQQARTGAGTFRLTLRGVHSEFHGGEYVYVYVDGFRQFGGIVLSIENSYWFESYAEPKTVLLGTDFNILFDKIFLYSHTEPVTEAAVYPKGITDRDLIISVYSELLDLPEGFNYIWGVMNRPDDVVTVVSPDEPWMVNDGQSLRSFMAEVTKVTNGVFWIDPFMILQYHSRTAVSAPAAITDGRGGISSRELTIRQDVSNMYNDVIVYGALAVSMDSIQDAWSSRYTDDDNANAYGLHQFAEIRSDLHTKSHIQKRAQSIFARRNLVLVTGSVTILEPFFQAGQVVEVSASSLGYEGLLVIHELEMRFPVSYEMRDGKFYTTPVYDLQLGLQPDDPWNIYDMLPWDFDFSPHPFFGGPEIGQIVDVYCPLPTITGDGVQVVAWSGRDPTGGTLPWYRDSVGAIYVWDSEASPYLTSDGAWRLLSYSQAPYWRMLPSAVAPIEILCEVLLDFPSGNDGYGYLNFIITNNDPSAVGTLCRLALSGRIYGYDTGTIWGSGVVTAGIPTYIRILYTGTQTFVKVWPNNVYEPSEWHATIPSTTPYGGDGLQIYPSYSVYGGSVEADLYGIVVEAGVDLSVSDIDVNGSPVTIDVDDWMYLGADKLGGDGWDREYTWPAPPDADLDNFGYPWIGWTNANAIYSVVASSNSEPVLSLFCEYKDNQPTDYTGLVKSYNQDAAWVKIPKKSTGEYPLSVRIKGEVLSSAGGGFLDTSNQTRNAFVVMFGLGNSSTTPPTGPYWYIPGESLGSVVAPWPQPEGDPTNWSAFEFEWNVNQAFMHDGDPSADGVYLWAWLTMQPEGSAISSYVGRLSSMAAGGGGWVNIHFQNVEVAYRYAAPVAWTEEPLHFCVPPDWGIDIVQEDNEPPIWGFHSEILAYDENGDFTLGADAVGTYLSVFIEGRRLVQDEDFDWTSGRTYRLSARARQGVTLHYVAVRYLVLSTWLLLPRNVSRPITTDTYSDGQRMPDPRGHL